MGTDRAPHPPVGQTREEAARQERHTAALSRLATAQEERVQAERDRLRWEQKQARNNMHGHHRPGGGGGQAGPANPRPNPNVERQIAEDRRIARALDAWLNLPNPNDVPVARGPVWWGWPHAVPAAQDPATARQHPRRHRRYRGTYWSEGGMLREQDHRIAARRNGTFDPEDYDYSDSE